MIAIGMVAGCALQILTSLAASACYYFFFIHSIFTTELMELYSHVIASIEGLSFLGQLVFALCLLSFIAKWVKERQRIETLEHLIKSLPEERETVGASR